MKKKIATPKFDLQLAIIKEKFAELKKIQAQITKVKSLYVKHDQIMNELLPLFVTVDADEFVIRREITIGNRKYKFNPHFFDVKKCQVQANVWKSTAFKTGTIE